MLIPVQCEYLALEGLSKLLNTIRKVKSGLNPALDIEGFLLTMYMRNRLNKLSERGARTFRSAGLRPIIQRAISVWEKPLARKARHAVRCRGRGFENYLTWREFLKRNRKRSK